MTLTQVFNGKTLTIVLNKCTSSKLALSTKLEDFNIPEFDFMAMADDSDVIGTCTVIS